MKPLLSLLFLLLHCCVAVSAQTASLTQSQNTPSDEFIREHNARRAKNRALPAVRRLESLRDLCVTEKGRIEIDQLISNWNYTINVGPDPFDDDKYSITIGQYQLKSLDSLKQKVFQFPKGTLFKWAKGDAQEFQQIKTHLEEHGMKLEREPEKTPQ